MDNSRETLLWHIERNIRILKWYKKPHPIIQVYYFFKNKIFETMHMDGRDSGLGELIWEKPDPYLLDVIYCTSRDISTILQKKLRGDPKNITIITDGEVITNIIDFLNTLSEVHDIDRDNWADFIENCGLTDSAKVEYIRRIIESEREKESDIAGTRYSLSQIRQ